VNQRVSTPKPWLAAPLGQTVLSLAEARRLARDSGQYLLCLDETQALLFQEPGWIKVEPVRGGAVHFVHPDREIRVARRRGIL
jgi:hypothetical protein